MKIAKPVENKYKISSSFGLRRNPLGLGVKFHYGVDFACPVGTPIIAVADADVYLVQENHPEFGDWIILRSKDATNTYYFMYCHLDLLEILKPNPNSIEPYEKVKSGDTIGFTGDSGRSSGPHLHFQVCLNSVLKKDYNSCAINPVDLFGEDIDWKDVIEKQKSTHG